MKEEQERTSKDEEVSLQMLERIQKQRKGKNDFGIFDGLIGKIVYLEPIINNKVIYPSAIFLQTDTDAKMNALKYRLPLKYLGHQYEEIVVPCTPAYQLSIDHSALKNIEKQQRQTCLLKVPREASITGMASGKRSAIIINDQGKLLRFKGCGNEDKGFNKNNNQSRGHHFYQTVKRQLYMTNKINELLKQNLGIFPPANTPLYAYDYPPQQIQRVHLANDLPLINKYCAVFQTQGDRRAGTHLISSLQVLYLTLLDHDKIGWEEVFKLRSRIDETGNIVEIVNNFVEIEESSRKFIDVFDSTKQINNYVLFKDGNLAIVQNYSVVIQQMIKKYVPERYQQIATQLMSGIKRQKIIILIETIITKIGYQMGQVMRTMQQNNISWGFYLDHGIEWHCNAHLNNFIVTEPRSSIQSSNFFLLPLDYDLAYFMEEFICIDLNSEHYGEYSFDEFQKYLCGEFMAMEMSLFGLELMNFKYGIEEQKKDVRNEKMSRVVFRDGIVCAFNDGMRKKKERKKDLIINWDDNIEDIRKLVQVCLYLSVQFQT